MRPIPAGAFLRLPEEEIGDEKGGKGRADLSRYYGLLKGDPVLDELEADAKFVRSC